MRDELTNQNPSGRVGANGTDHVHEDDEISLIDLLLVVARYKKLILTTVIAFFAVGFLYALLAPDEYTSSAKVVREISAEGDLSNIGALSALRGFGLSLGGATTGLTPEAYPDITEGREVKLAVVRDTFFFPDVGVPMTYVEYVRQNQSIFGEILEIPGKLISLIKSKPEPSPIRRYDETIIYLTEDEELAIKAVSDRVSTNVDLESGLMTIQTTTQDPTLSAELAASFVRHLVDRVRAILTTKARQNLTFIEERFEEAGTELRAAELALANFLDRNTAMRSATLTTERDRLQRQVSFKTQLYGDLQTQLTQAEIELQKSEPVITVLERPAPAIEPSGIGGKVVLIIFVLLGAAIGVAIAFVKWSLDQQMTDDEERRKMNVIRQELGLQNWIPRRIRSWVGKKPPAEAAGTKSS